MKEKGFVFCVFVVCFLFFCIWLSFWVFFWFLIFLCYVVCLLRHFFLPVATISPALDTVPQRSRRGSGKASAAHQSGRAAARRAFVTQPNMLTQPSAARY